MTRNLGNRNIAITGAAGFIGINFITHMMDKNPGSRFLNIDKLSYAAQVGAIKGFGAKYSNYAFSQTDICDFAAVLRVLQDFQPDFLINFAAETHVDQSITEPNKFIETNVMGVGNLLRAFSHVKSASGDKLFLQISTDEVFGSKTLSDPPSKEDDPYDPSSPYSASKAGAAHLVKAWHTTYGLDYLITNCTNNYGPYQHAEKFIPVIVASLLKDKKIPLYGNGKNIRDWIYVMDHVRGVETVLVHGEANNTYNISACEQVSNVDLIAKILVIFNKIQGTNKTFDNAVEFVRDRPGHDLRYDLDATKLKALHWRPSHTLEEGLEMTVRWHMNALAKGTSHA